jgi:DNA-binding CsgD family transcriptional regulator
VRQGLTSDLEPHLERAASALSPAPDLVSQTHEYADVVTALYAVGSVERARGLLRVLTGETRDWWYAAVWPAVNAAVRFEVASSSERDGSGDVALVDRLDELCAGFAWAAPAADAFRAEQVALRARARGVDTVEQWSDASDGWAAIGRTWDEAVCRLRLSQAWAANGARRDAADELMRTFTIARSLDARRLETEVRTLGRRWGIPLPAAASRETSLAASSLTALTAREREVLDLVAEGRTNDEVAGILVMSPKTASVHVSRILAKLHAANRTEAVAIARRSGLLG